VKRNNNPKENIRLHFPNHPKRIRKSSLRNLHRLPNPPLMRYLQTLIIIRILRRLIYFPVPQPRLTSRPTQPMPLHYLHMRELPFRVLFFELDAAFTVETRMRHIPRARGVLAAAPVTTLLVRSAATIRRILTENRAQERAEGCGCGRGEADAGFGRGPDGYIGGGVKEFVDAFQALHVGEADDGCGGTTVDVVLALYDMEDDEAA
jgi:hypothetical protein